MSEDETRKDDTRKSDLLEQIADLNQHFVHLMNERLPEVGERELELYMGVLGKLTAKLENKDKSIRDVAQEVFAEIASLVMAEMSR